MLCNPCDYAPGSGAQMEYDRHHSVKLAKKCHWSPSQALLVTREGRVSNRLRS